MAKHGRNEPCMCGSGKKYKQCHLPVDEGRGSGVVIPELPDLFERLRVDLIAVLAAEGFELPRKVDRIDDVLFAYLRVNHRGVPPRPRAVVRSARLLARSLDESVLESIAAFESESSAGADLTPRLTREHHRAGFDDVLLNDLGIHHFHLGQRRANGSVKGADLVLYAIVEEARILLLDVLPHKAFRTEDFTAIVSDSWPELVVGRELPDVLPPDQPFTAEERSALRESGVLVPIHKDGKVYLPPGGGVTSARTSPRVVDQASQVLARVRNGREWIAQARAAIAQAIFSRQGRLPTALQLRVRFLEDEIAFTDERTGLLIRPERRKWDWPPQAAADGSVFRSRGAPFAR